LNNPTYAGTFVYGRRRERKSGARPTQRQRALVRDPAQWQTVIHEHHSGYITWDEFNRNQKQLQDNTAVGANLRGGAVKGGSALLSGLMRCGRCGRMMYIRYQGLRHQLAQYDCMGAPQEGRQRCLSVGARNVDGAVSQALLAALRPVALQASLEAFEQSNQQDSRKIKALEMALQQARYEVQRARRQYDAVDPENRLVCGELEKRWEQALGTEKEAERALEEAKKTADQLTQEDRARLAALAEDLPYVWSHPAASVELKKRLIRCALTNIIVELVEEPPRIKLLLHWAGGVHTSLHVKRNRPGEHRRCTDREVIDLTRELATACGDRIIAQVLNRLGYTTGVGNAFNLDRVQSLRQYHKIASFDETKRGWLTLEETADQLKISQGTVRKLLHRGLLAGRQIVKYAPWMIQPQSIQEPTVQAAVAKVHAGLSVPSVDQQQPELPRQLKTDEVL
jgi:hypothetical protein